MKKCNKYLSLLLCIIIMAVLLACGSEAAGNAPSLGISCSKKRQEQKRMADNGCPLLLAKWESNTNVE